MWKPLPSRLVLKTLKGNLEGKAQRGQYLQAVDLGCYIIKIERLWKNCRRLTHFDVDTFVEEVLVKNGEWQPGYPEELKGSYVFVCCHGSRDRRCGECGPTLVSRFRDEIRFLGLENEVSVSPCSHIGGHKYAGNVIIFGSNTNGEVTGHWYGRFVS